MGTFHFPDERLLLKMWEIIPDDNFGLNLDPSHLILQMIDHERVVREFSEKIFHVHAKDLHIAVTSYTTPECYPRDWAGRHRACQV